jgi:hypothetical protein
LDIGYIEIASSIKRIEDSDERGPLLRLPATAAADVFPIKLMHGRQK